MRLSVYQPMLSLSNIGYSDPDTRLSAVCVKISHENLAECIDFEPPGIAIDYLI